MSRFPDFSMEQMYETYNVYVPYMRSNTESRHRGRGK
jgi:hypothetical protein